MKLGSGSYSVSEGEQVDVCLRLESGQLERDAQLCVLSQSDSANEVEDYNAPFMFFVILKPGENQSCFTVDTVDDNLVEGEEIFQLSLSSSDRAVVISTNGTTTIHIKDDDGAVS